MTTRIVVDHAQPDWRRIAALSTSFLAHVAAAMAIALPIALQTRPSMPAPIAVSMIQEPLPPPPPPADPLPLPRTHPVARATPRPPVAPPVPAQSAIQVAQTPMPIETIAPTASRSDAAGSVADAAGAGGPSRELAYDGALKLRYPPLALRQRQQGRVLLDVLVDADGRVQRIEIARSSGHAELDAAARDAVQRARFKPVLRDGIAQPAWGVVPIEFRLDRA